TDQHHEPDPRTGGRKVSSRLTSNDVYLVSLVFLVYLVYKQRCQARTEIACRPSRQSRPSRLSRRSSLRVRFIPVILALSVAVVGCEVRRTPAPGLTRQLQLAGVRRIMDRPALSPAAWSPDSQALAYSSDQRLWVYTLDRGEKDVAPAEAVTAGAWWRPRTLLGLNGGGTMGAQVAEG